MRKLARLEKIHKLIKLQEQDVLSEFKQLQQANIALKAQINDLTQHSQLSSEKIMQGSVTMNEINIVRKFNGNIETVLDQLNLKLEENNKKFLAIAEKVKQVRSRIKSIERLTERQQLKQDYQQQKHIQLQIEENINYLLSSQE